MATVGRCGLRPPQGSTGRPPRWPSLLSLSAVPQDGAAAAAEQSASSVSVSMMGRLGGHNERSQATDACPAAARPAECRNVAAAVRAARPTVPPRNSGKCDLRADQVGLHLGPYQIRPSDTRAALVIEHSRCPHAHHVLAQLDNQLEKAKIAASATAAAPVLCRPAGGFRSLRAGAFGQQLRGGTIWPARGRKRACGADGGRPATTVHDGARLTMHAESLQAALPDTRCAAAWLQGHGPAPGRARELAQQIQLAVAAAGGAAGAAATR